MDAQAHRGLDSTGLAICGIPRESGVIVRAKLGLDLDDFHYVLKEREADFLENPSWDKHCCVCLVISEPDNLACWTREAETICHRLEVRSVGKSLEIIKDDGDARDDRHVESATFCLGDDCEQTIFTMKRIATALHELGAELKHVVCTIAFLSDMRGGRFCKAWRSSAIRGSGGVLLRGLSLGVKFLGF